MVIAEQGKEKEMYIKNLRLLSPWLKDSMQKTDEKEVWAKLEVTYNEEGHPFCRYRQNGKTIRINGRRPVQEAKVWSDTVPIHTAGAIFVYGCGFGYPLFEIFEHKRPHSLVVVFEQDLCLFKAMLFYFDLGPMLRTHRFEFLPGPIRHFADEFARFFYSVRFLSCTVPTVACTLPAKRNFKEQYLQIHQYIFAQLALLVFYLGDDPVDNITGFCNMQANLHEILRDPDVSILRDTFPKTPAFIVSNGPSLDKDVRELAKAEGRGLIFAAGSAAGTLLKNDITPDIEVVTERSINARTCNLQKIRFPQKTALLCLALADRRVFPAFPGEKVPVFRSCEAMNCWANQYFWDGSALEAGSDASHLAVELAAYMGAEPIILVGQDYAYGPNRETRSADSLNCGIKEQKEREAIRSQPAVAVEGNNGRPIRSCRLWVDSLCGLEQKISRHPDRLFLNATQGGAKIDGTECIPLAEAIERYCTRPLPCPVNELISEGRKKVDSQERKKQLKNYLESVRELTAEARGLTKETIAGKINCRAIVYLAKREAFHEYRRLLETAYRSNNDVFNHFMVESFFRCFCQQVLFSNFYRMNRLGPIDTPEKIAEVFSIQYQFFCQLNAVCQSISVYLENAAENLEKLLEEMDGSAGKV